MVVHNVLRLDDTPNRIALGVFLGFVVGATPTIGLQMVIYFALVAVLPANKVSGILPIWLSNPITAVPLYYSNWKIGEFVITGDFETSPESKAAIVKLIKGAPGQNMSFLERMLSADFWTAAWDALLNMGASLWVGSLLVGFIAGALGYIASYKGVIAYRERQKDSSS